MSNPKNILEAIQLGVMTARSGAGVDTATLHIAMLVKKYLFNHFELALRNAKTEEELLLIKKLWIDIEGEK